MTEPIQSPCINICRIEPASRLCLGCWRSINEITRWGGMTADEQRRIMDELPQRKWQSRVTTS